MRSIPHSSNGLAIRVLHWVEWLVLILIAGATLVAIGQEMVLMVYQRAVMMHNILLLFIFLEILTMVGLYFQSGKLPIRYPMYIAMVSIARYITINSMTDMNGWTTIGLSIALLILAVTVLVIRYGHIHLSYNED
ncbi:MAG: phosphate-starvation-inducible PsiE family protein [Acidobacteriaceae bacterium]